jgi:hypothetical protein
VLLLMLVPSITSSVKCLSKSVHLISYQHQKWRVFNNDEFASIKKASIYLNKSKYASIPILICSLFNFHIKTTELTYELESYPWSHELKNNKNTFYSTFWLHQCNKFITSNNASIVTTSTNTLTPLSHVVFVYKHK